MRSSGSSSSGKPKSNHAVRSGTSPARKPSNRVLKNVEAAVPSVDVIHICGCTPVNLKRVFMVGPKPSKII